MSLVKHKYVPAAGSIVGKRKAQIYGQEIDCIIQRDGNVTPASLLEQARKVSSPLHDWFEWDDTLAAEQHRLNQASYLIRSIDIVIERPDGQESIRAFHNIRIERKDGSRARVYADTITVFSNDDFRAQVIKEAHQALLDWKKKYRQYQEFQPVFDAISKFEPKRR
jgi:hypothetical protein